MCLPCGEEVQNPGQDGQERKQELTRHWHEEPSNEQTCKESLGQWTRDWRDGEDKDAQEEEQDVLCIINSPSVVSYSSQGD
jgi:hypothetical protein